MGGKVIVRPNGADSVSLTTTCGSLPGTLQARGSEPSTRKSLAVFGNLIPPASILSVTARFVGLTTDKVRTPLVSSFQQAMTSSGSASPPTATGIVPNRFLYSARMTPVE